MGGVWERAKDLWDLGTHSLWLTLLVRKTALDCRKTSRHVHLVNREAFGVNLNSPSLNTHAQRKEVRNSNHFTFVFIRDHLLGLLKLA